MLPDPFWQRVDKSGECWLWTGQQNTDGYGQYKVNGIRKITNAENILRGESFSAVNARKTTCSRGHPFTPENTRVENGWRRCRACANEYQQAWQRRTA